MLRTTGEQEIQRLRVPTQSVKDCGKAVSQKKAVTETITDTMTAANQLGGVDSVGGGGVLRSEGWN